METFTETGAHGDIEGLGFACGLPLLGREWKGKRNLPSRV